MFKIYLRVLLRGKKRKDKWCAKP